MKRLINYVLPILFVLNLSPTAARAQEPPLPPFPMPEDAPLPPRAREHIELLLKWKIIEVLNLDEEQAAKVFPLYTRLRESRRDFLIERSEKVQQLKQVLDEKGEKKTIEKLLAELDKLDKAFDRDREKQLKEIKNSLELEQWARYLVFEAEFPREIRNMMREKFMPMREGWRRRW